MPDAPPQPAAESRPLSLWARLTGVFVTPGEVFESLKSAPPSIANWLVPALLFIAVSWLGATLAFSQPEIRRQVAEQQEQAIEKQIASGKLTRQQAEQAQAMMERYADVFTRIGAYGGPVAIAFASPFFWGLALWLGGLIFNRPVGYMQAVETVGLANMLAALEMLVHWLLVVAMGSMFVSLSPVLFVPRLDPTGPVFGLFSLLGFIGLWCLAVRAIGFARISGLALRWSALWVFGLYLLLGGALIAVGQLGQMLGGAR